MGTSGYQLLDSGGGRKLERFGDIRLDRPCSTAIWKRRLKSDLWEQVDASYLEDGAKSGWKTESPGLEEWSLELEELSLVLRLQRNGQVGLFPEHTLYLPTLEKMIVEAKGEKPRVLNLFGYTGLASLLCLKLGASVTHVDNSKRVLDWFSENLKSNSLSSSPVRILDDDAVSFAQREVRRGNSYEIIIADPPSFSRITKSKSWDLENVLIDLIEAIYGLVNKASGMLILTSHHPILGPDVVLNLLRDCCDNLGFKFEVFSMSLNEQESGRRIPAGAGLIAKFGME